MMKNFLNLLLFVNLVSSHSYIRTSIGTARVDTATLWSETDQIPCFLKKDMASPEKIVVQRGQVIDFSWPRNNHQGGFIKLALVPFNQSDDFKAFDDNVFHYGCFQTTCQARDPAVDPYGLDPPEFGENQHLCKNELTIPDWVEDGQYTIQWKWYGGSQFTTLPPNNEVTLTGMALFISCLDFTVQGGVIKPKPSCPTWNGGDVHTKDGKTCSFFTPEGYMDINEYQCGSQGCRGANSTGVPPEVKSCPNQGLPYARTPGQIYNSFEQPPTNQTAEQTSEAVAPQASESSTYVFEPQSSSHYNAEQTSEAVAPQASESSTYVFEPQLSSSVTSEQTSETVAPQISQITEHESESQTAYYSAEVSSSKELITYHEPFATSVFSTSEVINNNDDFQPQETSITEHSYESIKSCRSSHLKRRHDKRRINQVHVH